MELTPELECTPEHIPAFRSSFPNLKISYFESKYQLYTRRNSKPKNIKQKSCKTVL